MTPKMRDNDVPIFHLLSQTANWHLRPDFFYIVFFAKAPYWLSYRQVPFQRLLFGSALYKNSDLSICFITRFQFIILLNIFFHRFDKHLIHAHAHFSCNSFQLFTLSLWNSSAYFTSFLPFDPFPKQYTLLLATTLSAK